MTLFLTLFVAGVLTILLPCILPLIPIVLGVSIAGRSPWRPILTVLGMVISFVSFTFLLLLVLRQFVTLAEYLRIGTFYVLLLLGVGFLTSNRTLQLLGAVVGGFFFWNEGWIVMTIAQTLGATAMEISGKVATRIQQFGTNVQQTARAEFGADAPFTAFIIGLTMGLIWVPCAGPALGFAFTLVREEPGLRALAALSAYALGTALPLLLIGYGGQFAVKKVRSVSRWTGRVKQIAGVILIVTAVGLRLELFRELEIVLVNTTNFGTIGTKIEERLFPNPTPTPHPTPVTSPKLPRIVRAPEFQELGPWHNSEPLTLQGLRGKVVLIDFWTYSCINCIRTLPYIQGYWEKFRDAPFVLIGVHTPEFVFEKDPKNVAKAIARHGLTYPVAQDNDFGTWNAFANRYWPAKYLIDAEGYIRYTHFGEGAYEETKEAIETLLGEIGIQPRPSPGADTAEGGGLRPYRSLTPETYLGSRSWQALLNGPKVPTDEVVAYELPSDIPLHRYALGGEWQLVDDERQVLRSPEGEIRMTFLGGEINLVLGMGDPTVTPHVNVEVDGEFIKEFDVRYTDLWNLFSGAYGEHEITLHVSGRGLSAYAFTFGG